MTRACDPHAFVHNTINVATTRVMIVDLTKPMSPPFALDLCEYCKGDLDKVLNEKFSLDKLGRKFESDEEREGEVVVQDG